MDFCQGGIDAAALPDGIETWGYRQTAATTAPTATKTATMYDRLQEARCCSWPASPWDSRPYPWPAGGFNLRAAGLLAVRWYGLHWTRPRISAQLVSPIGTTAANAHPRIPFRLCPLTTDWSPSRLATPTPRPGVGREGKVYPFPPPIDITPPPRTVEHMRCILEHGWHGRLYMCLTLCVCLCVCVGMCRYSIGHFHHHNWLEIQTRGREYREGEGNASVEECELYGCYFGGSVQNESCGFRGVPAGLLGVDGRMRGALYGVLQ